MDTYILTCLFKVFQPRHRQRDAHPHGSPNNLFVSSVTALASLIQAADDSTHQRVSSLVPAQQRLVFDFCHRHPELVLEQLLEVMEPYLEQLPEPNRLFFRPSSVMILKTADYVVLSRHQEGYWYPHAPI